MGAGAVATLRQGVEPKAHQVVRDKTRPAHQVSRGKVLVVDKRHKAVRARLVRLSERADIPPRALESYTAAQEKIAQDKPGCRLKWTILAGVGAVESNHGRYDGRSVRSNGKSSAPIIGVPLDGGPDIKAIRDTDDGKLDRDPRWDRAVGPLQFIPSTWARVGADGDGDGRKDPQDMDDAALAAARYLCNAGSDLSSTAGQRKAILAYNDSSDYLHKVRIRAAGYAAANRN
jgi:membrane-bound lytic murein transglycosylase B